MSADRSTYHFKLVLLGNAGVGKSCLVLRFVRNEFFEDQETTIGGAWPQRLVGLTGVDVARRLLGTCSAFSLSPLHRRVVRRLHAVPPLLVG